MDRSRGLKKLKNLKKAFDTVDHHILLSKLELCDIKGTSLKWFESYLSGQNQIYDL